MRFVHIADVHLGACPDAGTAYTRQRPEELWETLRQVLEHCREEEIDLLLIAGDLFHRQPLLRELKELDFSFSELPHTKIVLIAGNHDYVRKDSYYNTFQWSENVFPLFGEKMEHWDFPELDTAVYGMSYHRREWRERLLDQARPMGLRGNEILLAHGGDEKHLPFDWRKLQKSGFGYVALGHIHRPQALAKNQIVYAGALEPTDRNDTGPHGYVQGRMEHGVVHASWVPFAKREYIHLEIAVDRRDTNGSIRKKLRETITEKGCENIYKVVLTGERDPQIQLEPEHLDWKGNVVELLDRTMPGYDFDRLLKQNENNLLGEYLRQFENCAEFSVESRARYEGVAALLGQNWNGD